MPDNPPKEETTETGGETNQNNQDTLTLPDNLTNIDKAIVRTIQSGRGTTKSEIANHVVGLGITKHPESVYRRLAKKDYLSAEIHAIRDHNRQYLDRLIVPDALAYMKKTIKNKELDEKTKLPYIKLAVDKSFGDIHHVEQPSVVHIDAINNAQFIIANDTSAISDDTA